MFGFGLAFQLLHNGFLLVPVLPVGGGSQVHQGDGLAAAGLLFQLGHRLLLGAVVDDTVDHAVVILHGHLRIFQRVVRQEAGNLGKTEAVAVMTGYLAVPLDGNDVADAHGRVAVVGGVFIVEAVFEIVQHAAFQVAGGQRGGVDQIIIVPLHRLPDGLEPFQPFIADVPQLVDVLHLINSEAVALVVEERLLPFLLVVHTRLDLGLKSRAFLPFLAGDGKDPVVGVQVSGIKSHRRVLALLDDVNGQITLHQLIGPFFGEGQKVPVQVAALFQIVLGQRRVRHGIFVQMLFRGVRQLGGFRGGGLGLCLHLLDSRLLQGLDHGQRRILNGLAAHPVHLADFQRGSGQGQLRRIQLAAVQLLPGGGVVERVVPAGIAGLNMKIGGIVQHQQGLAVLGAGFRHGGCFLCGLLGCSLFRLGGQVNAALLADNLIMPVNVRDQFPGCLVDGL